MIRIRIGAFFVFGKTDKSGIKVLWCDALALF